MKIISKALIAGAAVLGLGLSSLPAQAYTHTVYRTTYVTRVVHQPRYYDGYNYTSCGGCDTCGSCCSTCNYCDTCSSCCGYRSYSFWPFW